MKIRVNADLALDLDVTLKGEIYGDLIIGLITNDLIQYVSRRIEVNVQGTEKWWLLFGSGILNIRDK